VAKIVVWPHHVLLRFNVRVRVGVRVRVWVEVNVLKKIYVTIMNTKN